MFDQLVFLVIGIVLGGVIIGIIFWLFNIKKLKVDPSSVNQLITNLKTDQAERDGIIQEKLETFSSIGKDMEKEAENMRNIFIRGGPQRIGKVGEWQLKNILDKIELREKEEYEFRKRYQAVDGSTQELDVIVHLPGKRDVIIDSKVSLSGWEEYVNAKNEEEKRVALDKHIKLVRDKIKELSEKKYQHLKGIHTIDAVLMFMPNEFMFSVISEKDKEKSKSIIDEALDKKIIPVGPISLYAYLCIIENAWAHFKQNKNTEKIIDSFRDIFDSMANVYDSFNNVSNNIKDAQKNIKTAEDRTTKVTTKLENYKNEFNISTKSKDNLQHSFSFIKVTDIQQSSIFLSGLISEENKSEYKEFRIFNITQSSLFSFLFGDVFSAKENTYFVAIKDYLVFGNSSSSLEYVIDNYISKNTLSESQYFQKFQQQISGKSNLFFYVNR